VLSYLVPERTAELNGWVTEAGPSRMYAGIHYRSTSPPAVIWANAVARLAIALSTSGRDFSPRSTDSDGASGTCVYRRLPRAAQR